MEIKKLISDTESFVKSILGEDNSGHDWWHIQRVRTTALQIAKVENADLLIVELAALLHDIDDWKVAGEYTGQSRARRWLGDSNADPGIIERVCEVIDGVSFKGANVNTTTSDPECKVVQDADRLDAIGAIGIARTFAYGGSRGRGIYNPEIPPVMHNNFNQYQKSNAPTINHFYEKLLLLKDLMQTETGRVYAKQRHEFMLRYLDQFYAEWNGDDF